MDSMDPLEQRGFYHHLDETNRDDENHDELAFIV